MTGKVIVVRGRTFRYRETLKQMNFCYHKSHRAWIAWLPPDGSEAGADMAFELIHMLGIQWTVEDGRLYGYFIAPKDWGLQ